MTYFARLYRIAGTVTVFALVSGVVTVTLHHLVSIC